MSTPFETGPVIYNLFPLLAGPFEGWDRHLERARGMGFDWLFFNPVSYPGFSGSLYSVKDHYGFHPVLAPQGDVAAAKAFAEVLDRMRGMGLSPMMDLVINHTAVDSPLTAEHPDWYVRDETGRIVNPGAMDDGQWVTWGDLATVDNAHSADRDALWNHWDRLIAHHQGLGVRGFRCDAAYQVPAELWRHLIGRARERDPEAVFFAETLGCPIEDVIRLAEAGFTYTFNSVKWWDFVEPWCLEQYAATAPLVRGTIGFPESHDTPRLAAELNGDTGAVLARYAFCALFSSGVMITMGFEHGARVPLHVVRTRPEDWEEPEDLTGAVAEINAVKAAHALFNREGPVTAVEAPSGAVTALEKRDTEGDAAALLLVTRDPTRGRPPDPGADWDAAEEITPKCLAERHAGLRVFLRPHA
jgi:starch synthase (maltosyl-transferring)